MDTRSPIHRLGLPRHGARNPGTGAGVTTPGSFALKPDIGGPLMFASPDTPGMPAPSDKTAWDFLPEGWNGCIVGTACDAASASAIGVGAGLKSTTFKEGRGGTRVVNYPASFSPTT